MVVVASWVALSADGTVSWVALFADGTAGSGQAGSPRLWPGSRHSLQSMSDWQVEAALPCMVQYGFGMEGGGMESRCEGISCQ